MGVCMRVVLGFIMSHPSQGREPLSVNILKGHWLVEEKMHVSCVSGLAFQGSLALLRCGFLRTDGGEPPEANLLVGCHVCVNKNRLPMRRCLFQSEVLERFPDFWH